MNSANANDRLLYRNEHFCTTPSSKFVKKRDAYAIELRKERRQLQIEMKRFSDLSEADLDLSEFNVPNFASYPLESKLETIMSILSYTTALNDQIKVLQILRFILDVRKKPPNILVLISKLKSLLTPASPDEITSIIALIICDLSVHSKVVSFVVSEGYVPLLTDLIDVSRLLSSNSALKALANICQSGKTPLLVNCVHDKIKDFALNASHDDETLRSISWMLAKLFRGEPYANLQTTEEIIPAIKLLLNCNDIQVLSNTLYTVKYISDAGDTNILALINSQVIKNSIPHISSSDPIVVTPALLVIDRIVYSSTLSFIDYLLNENLLDHLLERISSPINNVIKDVLFILSNIVSGSESQKEAFVNHGVFQASIQCLSNTNQQCRIEASHVFHFLFDSETDSWALKLLEFDFMRALMYMGKSEDASYLLNVLSVLGKVYRQCSTADMVFMFQSRASEVELIPQLEALCYSQCTQVVLSAQKLLEDLCDHPTDTSLTMRSDFNL